ncbi:hypothetical protein MNBD_GAMMA01-1325 [hydrothermal vent metagenome]|uniref:Uncharacterized protein n=1 Tax=hydrothermal vent metagenome TaxID=652676 RepID=A0A3B0W2W7_9ZZZZ
MAVQLDENIQYVDPSSGELLVNGYIYIGTAGLEASGNTIPIYSSRALTTQLANPQRTGADGRALNKIWISGKYSLRVADSANVQKIDDRDLGESGTSIATIGLSNVQGTNAITATSSPVLLSLTDKQAYIFKSVAANTAAVTLKIDSFTAYPVKKKGEELVDGDIQDQIVKVVWNSSNSEFELINATTTRIKSAVPELVLEETDAAANNRIWGLIAEAEQLRLRVGNDAESSYVNALEIDRTANVIDLINLLSTALQLNGVAIPTISSADELTNKTIPIDDDNLTIQNNTDETKKLQFQCSEITTGTTRILTVPDQSGIIALRGTEDNDTTGSISLEVETGDMVMVVFEAGVTLATPPAKAQLSLSGSDPGGTIIGWGQSIYVNDTGLYYINGTSIFLATGSGTFTRNLNTSAAGTPTWSGHSIYGRVVKGA